MDTADIIDLTSVVVNFMRKNWISKCTLRQHEKLERITGKIELGNSRNRETFIKNKHIAYGFLALRVL